MVDYDTVAPGYARRRRPDARIAAQLRQALGDVHSLVNVGAGPGSYEPSDLDVVAVEPSSRMIAQRPPSAARAVQGRAEQLPFPARSFDAAMAVLTIHHWDDWRAGVAEMKRVIRRRVVLLTWDPETTTRFWLNEYLPQLADRDLDRFCTLDMLREILGQVRVEPVPIPHDCTDGFLGAYWRRPRAYLDADVRAGISSFNLGLDTEAGLARLAEDLDNGRWQRRWGELLEQDSLDLGYTIVIADAE